MAVQLVNELDKLVDAGILDKDKAAQIREYYRQQKPDDTNRLLAIFGVLGSVLVGLGLILIVAHNWDALSRTFKTVLVLLPVLLGQLACAYALFYRKDSIGWKEGSSAFLVFAIGAAMALISQIYQIPGELSSFMLTWALLSLPMVYLLNSSVTSLLYLAGITFYAADLGYWEYPNTTPYLYWVLLALVIPHYIRLWKSAANLSALYFHHWTIALSLIIVLGAFSTQSIIFAWVAYFGLFSLFYLLGSNNWFGHEKIRYNGFQLLGASGIITLLLIFSFRMFWQELFKEGTFGWGFDLWLALGMVLLIGFLTFKNGLRKFPDDPLSYSFWLFLMLLPVAGFSPAAATVIVNLWILGLGILYLRTGLNQAHLGWLNFGLLLITSLIVSRFFDLNLSFVLRGLLFLAVGIGFFAANLMILKRKKSGV
jgi:uncharacterized membrane protein